MHGKHVSICESTAHAIAIPVSHVCTAQESARPPRGEWEMSYGMVCKYCTVGTVAWQTITSQGRFTVQRARLVYLGIPTRGCPLRREPDACLFSPRLGCQQVSERPSVDIWTALATRTLRSRICADGGDRDPILTHATAGPGSWQRVMRRTTNTLPFRCLSNMPKSCRRDSNAHSFTPRPVRKIRTGMPRSDPASLGARGMWHRTEGVPVRLQYSTVRPPGPRLCRRSHDLQRFRITTAPDGPASAVPSRQTVAPQRPLCRRRFRCPCVDLSSRLPTL